MPAVAVLLAGARSQARLARLQLLFAAQSPVLIDDRRYVPHADLDYLDVAIAAAEGLRHHGDPVLREDAGVTRVFEVIPEQLVALASA
ncbi:MAG TPA: hypothetical protein VMA73_12680 [Streptosporangiaceae bacterium]|nr:hypothetical protein [Streptosporangiaceae bacterium]